MSSPFDALDAALSGAVMSAFGETVAATLRPRTRSDFAEGDDTSRPARQIRGVFSEAAADPALRGAARGADLSGVTRLSVQMAEFWVPASELAALPYAIRQGDRLAFSGRAGAPSFTISDRHFDEAGNVNLILATSEGANR